MKDTAFLITGKNFKFPGDFQSENPTGILYRDFFSRKFGEILRESFRKFIQRFPFQQISKNPILFARNGEKSYTGNLYSDFISSNFEQKFITI